MNQRLCVLLLFAVTALSGCVGVPFDYPKTASEALPADPGSYLGNVMMQWQADHGEQSGVVRLPHGPDALGARLRMMELAQESIDAQYFILKSDRAGALFAGKLLLAADRGVRVRLLIDDVFSSGIDRPLTLLDSHPNIEVRLFNPLSRQGLKYWSYLLDFNRANRRMHNKSFTVDGSVSIVGGRNIGEEYFELKQDVLFDDYEVMVMGPVVPEISRSFDDFWNSNLSVPVAAFGTKVDPADLDDWRAYIQAKIDLGPAGIYSQALNSTVMRHLRSGTLQPSVVDAHMVGDPADKLQQTIGDYEYAVLARELARRFREADREVLIITPYFIPTERGMGIYEELLERGIRLVIVTNSLASTNHVPVHAGYARYRKRLLQAGAEIHEIRARNAGYQTDWGYKPEFVTLHSKATAIDRYTIFIGSLNFDPRSIEINSEMGLFLESHELGPVFTANLFQDLPRVAYRVELDENGELVWRYNWRGEEEEWRKEPLASWGRRLSARLYSVLPIEDQL